MCISSSTVFYGIVVRLWSLVCAAKAHATLAPSLLALDLIALRQRKGTLQTTQGGAENLPSEVWEMMRRELYAVALDDALANWLAEMRCDECAEDGERRPRKKAKRGTPGDDSLPVHAWKEWVVPECEDCAEEFSNEVYDTFDRLGDPHKARVVKLLGTYGLCLPSFDSSLSRGGYEYCDPKRTIGIALPTPGLTDIYPSVATDRGHDCQLDASAHATISPSLFTLHDKLAISTRNPFTSLVRDYRLEIDTDPANVFPAAPNAAGSKDDAERETLGAGEPAWRLWTAMLPCV